jgi:DNA-binding protein HU-beta
MATATAVTKKPMTKSQIVGYFAEKFEMTRKQAADVVNEFAELAIAQTKKSGSFVMPGIGKMTKVKRKARMGRNPATGEAIKIPAKTVVKMRLAKACSEAVLGKK